MSAERSCVDCGLALVTAGETIGACQWKGDLTELPACVDYSKCLVNLNDPFVNCPTWEKRPQTRTEAVEEAAMDLYYFIEKHLISSRDDRTQAVFTAKWKALGAALVLQAQEADTPAAKCIHGYAIEDCSGCSPRPVKGNETPWQIDGRLPGYEWRFNQYGYRETRPVKPTEPTEEQMESALRAAGWPNCACGFRAWVDPNAVHEGGLSVVGAYARLKGAGK